MPDPTPPVPQPTSRPYALVVTSMDPLVPWSAVISTSGGFGEKFTKDMVSIRFPGTGGAKKGAEAIKARWPGCKIELREDVYVNGPNPEQIVIERY